MNEEKILLGVDRLSFSYSRSPLLQDLSLQIRQGEAVALVGANGSGKSTLIKCILGELKPDSGQIRLFGREDLRADVYDRIGYVPQVNVMEKIGFPVTCEEMIRVMYYRRMGFIKVAGRKIRQEAEELIKDFDLWAYRSTPYRDLSGGLQQRVMIARSMVNRPDLLILDEPTVGVDVSGRQLFFQQLNRLKREGLSLLLITHELEEMREAMELDHVYRLEEGSLYSA